MALATIKIYTLKCAQMDPPTAKSPPEYYPALSYI